MKVGLFIEKFDTSLGGRERSTAEIARLLTARGVKVSVVCRKGFCDDPDIELIQTGVLCRLGAAASFNHRCRKIIKEQKFDITHSVFPLVGADIYQLRNGVIPAVRDAHLALGGPLRKFSWPLNITRLYHWLQEYRVMSDPATLCLPVSDKVAGDIMKYYRRSENVRTVFNGICVPDGFRENYQQNRQLMRRQWGASDETTVLLCLANNHKLKGVSQLLKVFKKLTSSGGKLAGKVKLVIVGSDPAPKNVPDNVIFSRPVDDVFPLYSAADAVVLLSWCDACSRVVLEACSVGLPCVTTRCNGAAEILNDGGGMLVDSPDSFTQLARAIEDVSDCEKRAAMSAVAATKADSISMHRHVDKLIEIYSELKSKK